MRILVTNDDGIESEGLRRLTETAKRFGEVWVVAPARQCSAMSQRITIYEPVTISPVPFSVDGVKAFTVSGTPADCIKAAFGYLMKDQMPDWVFSGMNWGFNAGYDIAYSGTVGAAMEALMEGVPAIAFSNDAVDMYEVSERYMAEIAETLMKKEKLTREIWNVNFPACPLSECGGIEWDVSVETAPYYYGEYKTEHKEDGSVILSGRGVSRPKPENSLSDVSVLHQNRVAVGKIRCMVL